MCTTTCESFIAIRWTLYSMLLVGQHRVLQLVKLIFFLFPKPFRACFQLVESLIAIEWKVCAPGMIIPGTPASTIFNFFKISKTTASMFTTTCESFIEIGWIVRVPSKATPGTAASIILKKFNFQSHCEQVYNNLLKFNCNLNDVCTW